MRTQNGDKRPASPFARSAGAGAACLTVGILICVFTYFLRAVDFGPLRSLISFEDRIYTDTLPPTLSLNSGYHPIIFVDIDDQAMERWDPDREAAGATPRALLAQLVQILRRGRVSVIFLDYDFRSHLGDDSALRNELAKPGLTPVLLPTFFGPGVLLPCESQTGDKAPVELETAFDDTMTSGSVGAVHSIIVLGAYGLIEGTCSFYRVRVGDTAQPVSRMAAMLRAVELVQAPTGDQITAVDRTAPRLIPNRWWIRNETGSLYDRNGRLAYARIKASLYVRKREVDVRDTDLAGLENAIVIVSSTHRWAGDIHATPAGDLPGPLIYANLGLELQSSPAKEIPLVLQFLIDVALVITSALLTIPLCWLPIYRRLPPSVELTTWSLAWRLAREGLVIAIFGLLLFLCYFVVIGKHWSALPGWRFGVLSFLLSALVVLMVELTAALAAAATGLAEAIAMRLSRNAARSSEGTVEPKQSPDIQAPS